MSSAKYNLQSFDNCRRQPH